MTPFGDNGDFAPVQFRAHLEWLSDYPVAGLIVAGGTGELFSLTPTEVIEVVRTAKAAQPGQPIISGCGYGTRQACEMAQGIEAAGGDRYPAAAAIPYRRAPGRD
nr:dihydrodipicolinate synthase family protein [Puniceibacterium sp. IMCC21224]